MVRCHAETLNDPPGDGTQVSRLTAFERQQMKGCRSEILRRAQEVNAAICDLKLAINDRRLRENLQLAASRRDTGDRSCCGCALGGLSEVEPAPIRRLTDSCPE